MNEKHFIGRVCAKHPELGGKRLNYGGRCVACHNSRVAAGQRRKREARKIAAIDHYSGGAMCCAHCGTEDLEVLTIDHMNNDGAAHRATSTSLHIHSWLEKNGFPDGFRILCFNCNHKAYLAHKRGENG